MAVDAAPTRTLEELLEVMLTAGRGARVKAFIEALNNGWGGVNVADFYCGSRDVPLVMPVMKLFRHLLNLDGEAGVRARGHRIHTPVNVVLHDPDTMGGTGPGLGRGPA